MCPSPRLSVQSLEIFFLFERIFDILPKWHSLHRKQSRRCSCVHFRFCQVCCAFTAPHLPASCACSGCASPSRSTCRRRHSRPSCCSRWVSICERLHVQDRKVKWFFLRSPPHDLSVSRSKLPCSGHRKRLSPAFPFACNVILTDLRL